MRSASAFVLLAVGLVLAPPGQAAAPTLLGVGQTNRHAQATFSMPGADDGTIYFATKPDRATDESFLEENVKHLDLLTTEEIQAGRWEDEAQLDPGRYYAMVRASDYDCFGDPGCIEGFSNVLTLAVPKPTPRYRAGVRVYRYLSLASLVLRITPIGERVPYRVCWTLLTGRRRCVRGAVNGYSWNSPARDQVSVRTRGMPKVARFAWYVAGRKVASKRVRIPLTE